MENKNVGEDGRQQRQRQRYESVDQQQRACDHLHARNEVDEVAGHECAEKSSSQAGGQWRMQKVQKSIQAEDKEHQPQQDASDDRDKFAARGSAKPWRRQKMFPIRIRME